jgi:hypothetical protein
VTTAVVAPAGTSAVDEIPATVATTDSGTSAARETATCTSTRPVPPSTLTCGRTSASRATDHADSPIGCQIPAVTSVGPQSQPKLHAILRTYWNGSG